MDIRNWINQHSMMVTVVMLAVIALSVTAILWPGGGRSRPLRRPIYFYDLGTGSLFVAPNTEVPPITAPSGKMGVRAYVYSCGDCGDEAQRFIGYLETYTPEAQRTMLALADQPDPRAVMEVEQTGRLVCDPKVSLEWFSVRDEIGLVIPERWATHCGELPVTPCHPARK